MASSCCDFTGLPLIFFLCLLLPSARSVSFILSDFKPNMSDILFEGDAKPSNGLIEFNRIDYQCRIGRVIYAHRVRLWNLATGELSDFKTHFSFTVDTLGKKKDYGSGFAFFLAPAGFQIPRNSNAGFLGLFNTTTIHGGDRNQIVLVEFDSFSDPDLSDPSGPHVGIDVNSLGSVNSTNWNAIFHSGDPADVWIMYNATTKNLEVSWTYQETLNALENNSLSYNIDLMKILPEWVTIGFSASTGLNTEGHTLGFWEFNSTFDIITQPKRKNPRNRSALIAGLAVVPVALIGFFLVPFGILWRQIKQKRERKQRLMSFTSISDDLVRAGPRKFFYKDLALATKIFSKERKLGEGGFGEVYRGYLSALDVEIAVKKFSRGSRQGIREFVTEVKIIGQLRHRNLVQLIGWCHDKGEFLLVYEFMPNGSLDFHLFGEKSLLSWALRYNIALGLASGLLYLHEEWEQCVVHRDIKSSNIMLDSSFKVKLGDFGLAKLMDHELSPGTSGLAGTFGYLAPECAVTGRYSKESDVFSFGVVVLEIVTGRKAVYPVAKRLSNWDWYEWINLMVKAAIGHPELIEALPSDLKFLSFEASLPKLPGKMPAPMYLIPTESWGSVNPILNA
ncbi:L-type lectin-domain containing receptor kinase IX.1 [Morella rubra]|uniref:L-type lectin-domain containing receptor kinase IX.1 n=1 Tax=Morella rubra TaxID=262757 RepID=A0A6A1UMH0_9ROSI|nr:L-type lectin-domain containing receptor kinase IX.1 [Morella rubra]